MITTDIAVVGGGFTGMCAAMALAHHDVTLLGDIVCGLEDKRAIALNAASVNILNNLQVWPQLCGDAVAIKKVLITEAGKFGQVSLNAHDINLNALGYIVLASTLNSGLVQQLKKLPINIVNANMQSVNYEDKHWYVSTVDGKVIKARLLVGCDGQHSLVRNLTKIAYKLHGRSQTAILCNISSQINNNNTAYQRVTKFGTLALLPLQQGYKCVLSGIDQHTTELQQQDKLHAFIQNNFARKLGKIELTSALMSYPIMCGYAPYPIGPQVVLLGNAANSIHPLAAQGLNLGLRDCAALQHYIDLHRDNSINVQLVNYAKSRVMDHSSIRYTNHALVQLFHAQNNFIYNLCRRSSMLLSSLSPQVRCKLMQVACGLGHDLPLTRHAVDYYAL